LNNCSCHESLAKHSTCNQGREQEEVLPAWGAGYAFGEKQQCQSMKDYK
jgi:hypothetical protein